MTINLNTYVDTDKWRYSTPRSRFWVENNNTNITQESHLTVEPYRNQNNPKFSVIKYTNEIIQMTVSRGHRTPHQPWLINVNKQTGKAFGLYCLVREGMYTAVTYDKFCEEYLLIHLREHEPPTQEDLWGYISDTLQSIHDSLDTDEVYNQIHHHSTWTLMRGITRISNIPSY